jgi:hypothetical protein
MPSDRKFFGFVLMPFDKAFDDVYKFGIKGAAQDAGAAVDRVDTQIFHKETIPERIYKQICDADFIVAEMTGRNPNVFYKVGYAHAKDKRCIHLTREASDIPFDLKHYRHIIYGDSINTLRQKLKEDIEQLKAQFDRDEVSPSREAPNQDIWRHAQVFRLRVAACLLANVADEREVDRPGDANAIFQILDQAWKDGKLESVPRQSKEERVITRRSLALFAAEHKLTRPFLTDQH